MTCVNVSYAWYYTKVPSDWMHPADWFVSFLTPKRGAFPSRRKYAAMHKSIERECEA